MTRRLAALALATALLTGCGFHLRNALNLPENLGPVRVLASDPYSPLGELLADGLKRAGAEAAALADPHVATFVAGKEIRKVIVVPGKIVNIVAAG